MASCSVAGPGRKHSRKSYHLAHLDSDADVSTGSALAARHVPVSDPPELALACTQSVLVSSLQSIDAHLRSLEGTGTSTSAAVVPASVDVPLPAPAALASHVTIDVQPHNIVG